MLVLAENHKYKRQVHAAPTYICMLNLDMDSMKCPSFVYGPQPPNPALQIHVTGPAGG